MIHVPDVTDSIVARLASRLEFFNSLSQNRTTDPLVLHAIPNTDFILNSCIFPGDGPLLGVIISTSLKQEKTMGLFGLFSKKPEPFPENGPAEAQRRWFQETSPWNEMPRTITEMVIETFSDNPMVVLFVILSMQHKLVGQYRAIGEDNTLAPVARSLVGRVLYEEGQPAFLEVMEELSSGRPNLSRVEKPLKKALDCFETSVIFENGNPLAHLGLAQICQVLKRNEQFQHHIEQGLATLEQWENEQIPSEFVGEIEIAELRQQFHQLKAHY